MSKEGSIITCQNCGEPLEANWDKCPACLTPTSSGALTCPNCQAAIKENWKLCPRCKTALPGWETPPTHKRPEIHKSTDSDNDQIFVTIVDNEPMATVGFGFDLPITKGDVLGDRYRIIQSLGAGGFGAVYQVEDLVLNDQKALKVVVTGEGKAQRASEQILHEFKLREKINDLSYIVKAQDPRPCEFKGLSLVLLPMEFADGRSMRHWLAQHQNIEKRQKEGLELFKQACLGVKAIHDAGLVHLDIKPENILLANGKAKIADFGIGRYGACQFSKNPDQLLRQGIGTPQYMSPEQFHVARQKDVGPASDIYSLGIVLFELLDGNLPFDGTPIELRDKHLKMPPPQLPEKLGRWWGIVKRCLEKKVEDRYHNIKQLIKDLERMVQGTAISTDVSCPQCGHINANPIARECDKCRTNLAPLFRLCPVCDKSVRLDIETCTVCGKAVAAHYRLLDRKERIEKLKDEDPIEAIELLETVLQQETEDYHERAIQLLKDLRKKQSQINSLTGQAHKAEAACLPEKAIEIWHEVLSIIPRHRIALEQVQKLETLMKDFTYRLKKTTSLMDEAKFENADKLLQGCLELIPTRKDVKEMLKACRKRAQEYTTTFQQASISQRNKRIQDADKQINKALLQAPRSREALALADKVHEITEKTDNLLQQAKLHLARAEFPEAQDFLGQVENLWPTMEQLKDTQDRLKETQNKYNGHIKLAVQSKTAKDLDKALEELDLALTVCHDSDDAKSLLQEITQQKACGLIEKALSVISFAQFEKAGSLLKQAESVWAMADGLNDAKEKLTCTRSEYNQYIKYARIAMVHKNFKKALEAIDSSQVLCPDSQDIGLLRCEIENAGARWKAIKKQLRNLTLGILKWTIILAPFAIGIDLLVYLMFLPGILAILTGFIAISLQQDWFRKIYKAIEKNRNTRKTSVSKPPTIQIQEALVDNNLDNITAQEIKSQQQEDRYAETNERASRSSHRISTVVILIVILAITTVGVVFFISNSNTQDKTTSVIRKQKMEMEIEEADVSTELVQKDETYESSGNLKDAIEMEKPALDIQPENTEIKAKLTDDRIDQNMAIAKANNNKENGKIALGALETLLQLDPDHPEAKQLYEKISAYYAPREPLWWINKAKSISKDFKKPNNIYEHIAVSQVRMGDIAGANATVGGTVYENVCIAIAVAHAENGDIDSAETVLENTVFSNHSTKSDTYRIIAEAMVKKGDVESAKALAIRAGGGNFRRDVIYYAIVNTQIKAGSLAGANNTTEQIDNKLFKAKAYCDIAVAYAKTNDLLEANKAIDKAKAVAASFRDSRHTAYDKAISYLAIARALATAGDIKGAKSTMNNITYRGGYYAFFSDKKFTKAIIEVESNNISGAKAIIPTISSDHRKLEIQVYKAIAEFYIKAGNIAATHQVLREAFETGEVTIDIATATLVKIQIDFGDVIGAKNIATRVYYPWQTCYAVTRTLSEKTDTDLDRLIEWIMSIKKDYIRAYACLGVADGLSESLKGNKKTSILSPDNSQKSSERTIRGGRGTRERGRPRRRTR